MDNPDTLEPVAEADELARFRRWPGFLLASVLLNLLFLYGMLAMTSDAALATWYKTLIWLPFNVIATVLYYVFWIKLGRPGVAGLLYRLVCFAMAAGNWLAMFAA